MWVYSYNETVRRRGFDGITARKEGTVCSVHCASAHTLEYRMRRVCSAMTGLMWEFEYSDRLLGFGILCWKSARYQFKMGERSRERERERCSAHKKTKYLILYMADALNGGKRETIRTFNYTRHHHQWRTLKNIERGCAPNSGGILRFPSGSWVTKPCAASSQNVCNRMHWYCSWLDTFYSWTDHRLNLDCIAAHHILFVHGLQCTAHPNRHLHTKAIKTNENVSGAFYSCVAFAKFCIKKPYTDATTATTNNCTGMYLYMPRSTSTLDCTSSIAAAAHTSIFSPAADGEEIANGSKVGTVLFHTVICLCRSDFSFIQSHPSRNVRHRQRMPPYSLM